jgi:NADH dehydrogenase FAD-containing subunit
MAKKHEVVLIGGGHNGLTVLKIITTKKLFMSIKKIDFL